MPRIATKPNIEVVSARAQLKLYLEQPGCSEVALSRMSGVPQYTISKFLIGRIKSITPEVKRFLPYANIGIKLNIERLFVEPIIIEALGNAWDGTDDGIEILATAINALAPIIQINKARRNS